MSKEKLDEFLGKNEQSPLDTDKVYGGKKETLDTIRVPTRKRTEEEIFEIID